MVTLAVAGCGDSTPQASPASSSKPSSSTGSSEPSSSAGGSGGATKAVAKGGGSAALEAEPVSLGSTHLVAQATAPKVKVYRARGDEDPFTTLANPQKSGAPLVFYVLERRPGWLRVLLPLRPNGSQGWIRSDQVSLAENDYRLVISTGDHRLTVHRGSEQVMDVAVGLGTSTTPTPGGVYYIKELIEPPNPSGPYGPYAFGLSGYSEVLDEFLGGDGTIGIHGTNEPSGIGRNVSHGCIRMTNDDITKLAGLLPLGTPVQIT